MSVLQAIDLKKYYGTEPNITRALDGVNFSVEDGEFVAVVGTSGSGKSTLLHMMGGLDTPTSGTVIVRGEELAKKNDEQITIFRRRNIGFSLCQNMIKRSAVTRSMTATGKNSEPEKSTSHSVSSMEMPTVIVLEDKADVAAAEDGELFVVLLCQFFASDNQIGRAHV